jgi:hypothetical protein
LDGEVVEIVTLEDLGNIGDFLGGIAVIVTLIYLARQIRENTKVARLQTLQTIKSDALQLRIAGIQSPDIAVILAKSVEDSSSLTTTERIRFNLLCAGVFENFDQSYQAAVMGLIDHFGNEHLLRSYLSQEAVRQWWSDARDLFHPDFVSHVESNVLPGLEEATPHWQSGSQRAV